MMKITCLGQGSKGNCWIADYDGELLIIDAGLSIKTIKRGINYNLMAVQGVLCTHKHKDHSMAVDDLRLCGLSVFTPFTVETKTQTYGHYRVQAFPVPHGDCDCYGFYIKIGDHRIIYATDFEHIPFVFKKQALTDMIIECNYQDEYVDKSAENANHKILDHSTLETTIGIVKANQTESLRNVIITHMGDTSCNALECVNAIKEIALSGVNVDFARAGETYEL